MFVFGAIFFACSPMSYLPHGDVEEKYLSTGPFEVLEEPTFGCCDRDGEPFHAWLPDTDAAAPIVIWGNGTGASTEHYAFLLEHLASWGFAVVAPENEGVGDAVPLLEALDAALLANAEPSSPLFGRLDTDRVGAVGHSQGAGGVTNLMLHERQPVRAVVTLNKPDAKWCSRNAPCPSPAGISAGAILYLTGTRDMVMSPPRVQKGFFEETPEAVTKATASLKGAGHNDITGQPNCTGDIPLCRSGAEGFTGYTTAWLATHLLEDTEALKAFVDGGELSEARTDWRAVRTNVVLP